MVQVAGALNIERNDLFPGKPVHHSRKPVLIVNNLDRKTPVLDVMHRIKKPLRHKTTEAFFTS
jgi:hypothetical protein